MAGQGVGEGAGSIAADVAVDEPVSVGGAGAEGTVGAVAGVPEAALALRAGRSMQRPPAAGPEATAPPLEAGPEATAEPPAPAAAAPGRPALAAPPRRERIGWDGPAEPAPEIQVGPDGAGRVVSGDEVRGLDIQRRDTGLTPDVAAAAAQRFQADIRPGDVLSPHGRPFMLRSTAIAEAERIGGEIVPAGRGWVVRPPRGESDVQATEGPEGAPALDQPTTSPDPNGQVVNATPQSAVVSDGDLVESPVRSDDTRQDLTDDAAEQGADAAPADNPASVADDTDAVRSPRPAPQRDRQGQASRGRGGVASGNVEDGESQPVGRARDGADQPSGELIVDDRGNPKNGDRGYTAWNAKRVQRERAAARPDLDWRITSLGDDPAVGRELFAVQGFRRQASRGEAPIVRYRKEAAEIERRLPPAPAGSTRLWRGNRPGQDRAAPGEEGQFTTDLPGIALPFRDAYDGSLTYVDVPTEALKRRGQASTDTEFAVPAEWAQRATVVQRSVDERANDAATSPTNDRPEPTQAQKEAGNYKVGRIRVAGLDISVENPQGSTRSGTDRGGKEWSRTMRSHYGYIRGTEARDGDKVDVFVRPGVAEDYDGSVFVVDQVHPDSGLFDEHKFLVGWPTEDAARRAYLENYARDWKGLGAITQMSTPEFKEWVANGTHRLPVDRSVRVTPKPDAAATAPPALQRAEAALRKAREDKGEKRTSQADPSGQQPLFSRPKRETGLSGPAARPFSALPSVAELQQHPDYRAAKAGDPEAASRLISSIMTADRIDAARKQFAPGVVFVPPLAMERSGPNMIPVAFAQALATVTGGEISTDLHQTNRAGHTGANAMERLVARPMFDGPVRRGARYVVVDDVTTMGGALAEMADHLRAAGGEVVGSAVIVNASRTGTMEASPRQIREIERRHGSAVRDIFNVEPASLTAAEAGYVLGFRDADALRARAAAATRENNVRSGQGQAQGPRPDQVDGEPRYRRGRSDQVADVRATIDDLTAKWANAPPIEILDSFEDAPKAVRDYEAANPGEDPPAAFFYGGKVYVIADQAGSPADVRRAVFHEALGHFGLRGTLGKDIEPVLRGIVLMRAAEAKAKANAYKLNWANPDHRLIAAEEVLAELAETRPTLGIVQRAIAAVRAFLRKAGLDLKLSDAEIIRDIIIPAREWVENGAGQDTPYRSDAPAWARVDQTETDAFKRWFGDSKVVDAEGKPRAVYHGTAADFDAFDAKKVGSNYGADRSGFFFHSDPSSAWVAAGDAAGKGGAENIMPVYLHLKNPLIVDATGDHTADAVGHLDANKAATLRRARARKSDGIIVRGRGDDVAYVAFRPEQIKSATGNRGTFDPSDPDIRFMRAKAFGNLTPAQERALSRVGGIDTKATVGQRMAKTRANMRLRFVQGVADQFRALKDLDQDAYMQARLSKASDGTLEAMMLYGRPFMNQGVPDVKIGSKGKEFDYGFAKVLASLHGEHERFLWWVAAHRAERLKAQGRENLFDPGDISELKTLSSGQMADGKARSGVYAAALQQLNAFNDAVLEIAEQSGLIDPEARRLFRDQPYVPFYRVMEDGLKGPTTSSGLTNQQAWRKLKGGSEKLNDDLLGSVMLNWAHVFSASAKNRAALAAVRQAEQLGIAYPVSSDTKGAVRVTDGGQAVHVMIEDPYVMEALTALGWVMPAWMRVIAAPKRIFTFGVTASPQFKVKNLMRDALSAVATADLSLNVIANVTKGAARAGKRSQSFASMMAGGGAIRFGAMLDGQSAERTRQLVRKQGGVLLDESGTKKLSRQLTDLWDTYAELGDRAENANRVALYERLVAKGHSPLEANFMARDLMDFSLQGRWPVVRFLAATVPFLNARIQGLYKLGRAAGEDPNRFWAVTGAVALASLALLGMYGDDDDWKKREDWDRDANWWFKVGDIAYRIPKPFEVGAIGTLVERTAELALSDEMDWKRFSKRIGSMLASTFSFDPTPQLIKPLYEVGANKNAFLDRPIETTSMQRLKSEDRFNESTTVPARFLGQLGLPNPATLITGNYEALSPVQWDHLIRGYFGWVGSTAALGIDSLFRPFMDRGARPDYQLREMFFIGNFAETLPANQSRYVTKFYEQANEVEQAYASMRAAEKRGDRAAAKEIYDESRELLKKRPLFTKATKGLSEINAKVRTIEASKTLDGAEKRARIDRLRQEGARLAQRAVTN
ncbi:MAG: LPD38 domain-containing protein [Lautropia sp.]